jgi:hypothetical protein
MDWPLSWELSYWYSFSLLLAITKLSAPYKSAFRQIRKWSIEISDHFSNLGLILFMMNFDATFLYEKLLF